LRTVLLVAALLVLSSSVISSCDDWVGDDPNIEDEALSVEIVENPDNVLSVWVRWSTGEPANTRVEFGEDTCCTYFVEDDEPVTDHEILVFGLHPSSTYGLRASSESTDGRLWTSDEVEVISNALPYDIHSVVTVHQEELAQEGWTLLNLVAGEMYTRTFVLMVDMEGRPVWYHEIGNGEGRPDIQASLVDGDRVLIGGGVDSDRPVEVNLAGQVVWEGPLQPQGDLFAVGQMHHVFSRLPDGHYLTLRLQNDGGHYDEIVEFDEAAQEVWVWNAGAALGTEYYPWGNMAATDPDQELVLYNASSSDAVYAVDRGTGEILWTLGKDRDFEMVGNYPDPWFSGAHATEMLGDGTLLMYDNGDSDRGYSRAVQYALDLDEMTFELIWEYTGGDDQPWQNIIWGDADRLDNGNTLVTAGSNGSDSSHARVAEVTPDGTIVWEFVQSDDSDEPVGTYMSERIPVLLGRL